MRIDAHGSNAVELLLLLTAIPLIPALLFNIGRAHV